jgi:hypothetical protein
VRGFSSSQTFAQPVHQRQVVGEPAEERLAVEMRLDETREVREPRPSIAVRFGDS